MAAGLYSLVRKSSDLLRRGSRVGTWEDLPFPAQATQPQGASVPTWDSTHLGWSFTHTVDKTLQIVVQMRHSWIEQTPIRPHIHLKTISASSGKTVTWTVKYRRAAAASGPYEDWVSADVVFNVPADSGQSCLVNLGTIDMSGYKISCMIDFDITRKTGGGTDLAGPIIWKQFDIHHLQDSLGSSLEFIK